MGLGQEKSRTEQDKNRPPKKSGKGGRNRVRETQEIMDTPQPNTIVLNGVEVPSNYFFWKKITALQEKVDRLRKVVIFLGFSVVILAASLLLI